MAEKQFTVSELNSMNKTQLENLAAELNIQTTAKTTKQSLITAILEHFAMAEAASKTLAGNVDESESEEFDNATEQKSQRTVEEISQERKLDYEIRLAEIQLERDRMELERVREQERARIEVARINLETERLRQTQSQQQQQQQSNFKVQEAAKLLPKLINEQDIETFIIAFERIAHVNNWPKSQWPAILQTQLKGKALKVFSEMPLSECQDYDILKTRLIATYELVPEHYRKKFRSLTKVSNDSYTDFAFKLSNLFKRWLEGLNAYNNVDKLRQAVLMEQFMETLPQDMKLWITDQKAKTIEEMARFADNFVTLRKSVSTTESSDSTKRMESANVLAFKPPHFPSKQHTDSKPESLKKTASFPKSSQLNPPVRCRYCRKPNHTISECFKLKRKKEMEGETHETSVKQVLLASEMQVQDTDNVISPLPVFPVHPLFAPFCNDASICCDDGTQVGIKVLRDTAALQSLLLESAVSPSCYTHTGEVRLLKGVSSQPVEVPLVELHLKTDFIDENVLCGLISELPEGVDFLLGNDIWFKAHSVPCVVVTRAQSAAAKLVELD